MIPVALLTPSSTGEAKYPVSQTSDLIKAHSTIPSLPLSASRTYNKYHFASEHFPLVAPIFGTVKGRQFKGLLKRDE